ncbi:putative leucine-rich repeat receptor-like protein kinase [Iris pallida]|uniref:non-specific serine/threonine protein kinase n=1 Tax=Iris pallida TaxID=29817 RepID=A0AAX6E3T3_IRIPA|nr:putative leucine-rich repeat receptor-like protein kinase [Iris pallida]
MDKMKNTPPSWGQSSSVCIWEGITCNNFSRVISLKLYNMGIEGTLSSDIGSLTELQTIDLSYNKKLGGPLPQAIGNLKQLTALFLVDCSFSGSLPSELGNLSQIVFLSLTSNKFTGRIPASLGMLSNLALLDLAKNQLTGPLPISTGTEPGLDRLINTKHFHFNKNQLSGSFPEELFSSDMTLEHIICDRNQFTGRIPVSVGLVQSLTVIRLDKNSLSGPVPSNLNNLTRLKVLNLGANKLSGAMPNLTGMNDLRTIDLSNNLFEPSEFPAWISDMENLTALMINSGGLYGEVPQKLFSFPYLQQVILKNNSLNGSLDMGSNISKRLHIVNFENNALTSVALDTGYNNTIILVGNPVCSSNAQFSETSYCVLQQDPVASNYSISHSNCSSQSCPQNLDCPNPYQGMMVMRAPSFRDVADHSVFITLVKDLWEKFGPVIGSVTIENPFIDGDNYLQVLLKLCPITDSYFNRTVILVNLDLSNKNYGPPGDIFGPYYFDAFEYNYPGGRSGRSFKVMIIGMAVGCTFLIVVLVAVGLYALRQRRRAQRAIEVMDPFASWARSGEGISAPELQGARWFSYDELRKCTNDFPEINEIGSGGFGKVYRGVLSDGKLVAVKRARAGSFQGGAEFKTEIELLSRIHHKNLVQLEGFCFQRGERMLVYEYIPNGSLRECLCGEGGIVLSWQTRLSVALDSAMGLAYLHEHANPPIIHRDVKSTNILLDENLNAKVADFGLSKLASEGEEGQYSTQVKGTLGYLDPEYYSTQMLTAKSDVYSFGVVMLELVTALPPIHEGKYIVREVRKAVNKNEEYYGLKDLIDPAIIRDNFVVGLGWFVELALECLEESSAGRPAMSDVVKEIEMMVQDAGGARRDSAAAAAAPSARRAMPRRDASSSSNYFEYSGGYSFSTEIVPK